MNAGRDLDALVAEMALGCRGVVRLPEFYSCSCPSRGHNNIGEWGSAVKDYSTDIAAAWAVVEKMPLEMSLERWPEFRNTWRCSFERMKEWVRADTAPLAICLAALRACGIEAPDTPAERTR